MKTATVLLIAAGVGAVWYFSQLGLAAADIQIVLQGVKFNSLTDVQVVLSVQNVTNAQLTINSMTGVLMMGNMEVGNLSDFTAATVPANGEKQVTVDVQLSVLTLPSEIVSVINNQTGSIPVEVKGNVNVNNLVIPFDLTETFNY